MAEIEDIESWVGAEVVDAEGEKIGKLDELFVDSRRGSADLASVKSGLIGHRHLVPLAGATFSRGHVRVAYAKELVGAAPTVGADVITNGDAALLGQHYGLASDAEQGADEDARFERASAVRARRERADADLQRADDLDAQAAEKDAEAQALQGAAQEREQGASGAMSERDRLLQQAEDARRSAGDS